MTAKRKPGKDGRPRRCFNLRLDETFYLKFAAYCAREQISKNLLIEELLIDFIKNEKKR